MDNKNQRLLIRRLILRNNKIFSNIDINFVDSEDKYSLPYISMIIGPNGTGKSNLLRIIVDLFRQIYDYQVGKNQIHVYGEFYLMYSIGDNIFEYANTMPDDEFINQQGKKRRNIIISRNGTLVDFSDLELPTSLIASSIMLTDKFYFSKADSNYPFYHYLGVRTSSNQSGTLSYLRKSIDLLIKSSTHNRVNFLSKFKKILNVLGFDNRITIRYKISYKEKFLNGNLTKKKFIDIYENWEDNFKGRNTAPYGHNRFLTLKKTEPEKIEKVVDLLNKIKNEGFLKTTGTSKTEYLTYHLIDEEITKEDYDIIIELNKLDILRHPSIDFYKSGVPLGYKQSSSGEQHIITTLIGIISKIEQGGLVLLDEPEISLHPNWQMRYITDFIIGLFSEYKSCQFIIATHSHFLASDIRGEYSKIIGLYKTENGIQKIDFNDIDTFGWSAEEVLYEVFKVKSTRNAYVEQDLIMLLDIVNRKSNNWNLLNSILNRLQDLNLSEQDPTNIIINKGVNYYNSRNA